MCWFFGYAHLHPNDRMLGSRVTVGAHREPKMSSTHEPSQLLEPSNLLEPLDLSERQLNFEFHRLRSIEVGSRKEGPPEGPGANLYRGRLTGAIDRLSSRF